MGRMTSVSRPTRVELDYRERQQMWLDSLDDRDYAALARSFFELNINADANADFLRSTENEFDLICKLRKEP